MSASQRNGYRLDARTDRIKAATIADQVAAEVQKIREALAHPDGKRSLRGREAGGSSVVVRRLEP